MKRTDKNIRKKHWMFLCAMICLSASLLLISVLNSTDVPIVALTELIVLGTVYTICISDRKGVQTFFVAAVLIIAAKIIIAMACIITGHIGWYPFYIFICVNQIMFAAIYYFMRLFFDPDYSFIEFCRNIAVIIIRFLVGEQTLQYLQEKKRSAK